MNELDYCEYLDLLRHQNALRRVELVIELEKNDRYPNNYDAIISTVEEMERDLL